MGGLRLLVRSRPVTEDPTLARAHLEEPEVLAVLRCRAIPGLAAGHTQSLTAVAAEDLADRLLGRKRRQRLQRPLLAFGLPSRQPAGTLCVRPAKGDTDGGGLVSGVPQARPVLGDLALRLCLEPWICEQPGMPVEEREHRPVFLDRRDVPLQLDARAGTGRDRGGAENEGAHTCD